MESLLTPKINVGFMDSHTRQELDHYSDPSGTESCNVQTSLDH